MVPQAMIAVTIGESAREATKGPGTRAKMVALLRTELIKAQEYDRKRETAAEDKKPARDFRLEALARVLKREVPLLVTVHRAQDIMSALRVAKEFNIRWFWMAQPKPIWYWTRSKKQACPSSCTPRWLGRAERPKISAWRRRQS